MEETVDVHEVPCVHVDVTHGGGVVKVEEHLCA